MVFIYFFFFLRKKKSGKLGHWATFLLQPHWSSWVPFALPLCIQHSQLNLTQNPDWHSRQPHSSSVEENKHSKFQPSYKNLPALPKTRVQSLGEEYLLEKEMATHCSILAWRIPWTEEPGGPQSMWSHGVGQEEASNTSHGTAGLLLGCPLLTTYGNKGKKSSHTG